MQQSPSHTFVIPRSFHMAYSPLGRWIRQRVRDVRRAESLFIVLATGTGFGLLFVGYLSWLWPGLLTPYLGVTATGFYLAQAGLALLFCLACVFGFKPAILVSCLPAALRIDSGTERCMIPYPEIQHVRVITAVQYHRHYRRYRATRCFVNRMPPKLLLLETKAGPVVLGLSSGDATALQTHVEAKTLIYEKSTALYSGCR